MSLLLCTQMPLTKGIRLSTPSGSLFNLDIMFKSIKEFYSSTQWKQVRTAYKKTKQGLCERCLAKGLIVPADEVHHKVRLTRDNINDYSISLNFDNLEALCETCHDKEHEQDQRNRYGNKYRKTRRYAIDKYTGKVIARDSPPTSEGR